MSRVTKCSQCGRRMRRPDGWNVVHRLGVVVGHLCPTCQTPEENAEAVVNEAVGAAKGVVVYKMAEHTSTENAEVTLRALWQHTEDVWRAWLTGIVDRGEAVALDLDALTDQAWGSLPEPWKSAVSRETGRETIRDHLEWLSSPPASPEP